MSADAVNGTMRALRIREFGGPEVLRQEQVPVPEVADDEVLINIA